jgi:hypothetical protein
LIYSFLSEIVFFSFSISTPFRFRFANAFDNPAVGSANLDTSKEDDH